MLIIDGKKGRAAKMLDFGLKAQEENKNLLQYYWFESAFSPHLCQQIIDLGKSFSQEGCLALVVQSLAPVTPVTKCAFTTSYDWL